MNAKLSPFLAILSRAVRLFLVFVVPGCILFAPGPAALAGVQVNIPGPAGSGAFGQVTLLANGNFLVVDATYDAAGPMVDAGAVYLYNGATGSLISVLTGSKAGDQVGSGGVTVLKNGNFVVASPNWDNGSAANAGAVTWGSGAPGVNGAISPSNSLVGAAAGSQVGSGGVIALSNGNYAAASPHWNSGLGAVTWGSGASGVQGLLSASNSLTGSAAGDQVGSGGLYALSNGNYVAKSPEWNSGAGAFTWGNGLTGRVGTVSASNSLVGTKPGDLEGFIMELSASYYLVINFTWDNGPVGDAGAVTWASSTAGVTGVVSASNSLVGTTTGDMLPCFAIPLSNGNYVVASFSWDNGATVNVGAVTWGSAASGVKGAISTTNSLTGSHANDMVGQHGVLPLANGHYVVSSPQWDNGATANVGALTWGSGTSGVKGTVSTANSLTGSSAGDQVGSGYGALAGSSYLVTSPNWAGGKGAVTWVNAAATVSGVVSAANSLTGSTAGDQVGSGDVITLNGSYVAASPTWNNGAGAVTWINGASGLTGVVSAANSLVGSTFDDQVGSGYLTALSSGNYLVVSPNWDNSSTEDAGAVTWGSGAIGVKGAVSPANSLVGSTAGDQVGYYGADVLTNGNYVVRSPFWDNGGAANAGAVTWGSGAAGVNGAVSAANSLIGPGANASIGSFGITALTNGNYVLPSLNLEDGAVTWRSGAGPHPGVVSAANSLVGSTYGDFTSTNVLALSSGSFVVVSQGWDNSSAANAGAVTFSVGRACAIGLAVGPITSANSVLGAAPDGGAALNFAYDPTHQQLIVGRPADNAVTLFPLSECPVYKSFLPAVKK